MFLPRQGKIEEKKKSFKKIDIFNNWILTSVSNKNVSNTILSEAL